MIGKYDRNATGQTSGWLEIDLKGSATFIPSRSSSQPTGKTKAATAARCPIAWKHSVACFNMPLPEATRLASCFRLHIVSRALGSSSFDFPNRLALQIELHS